MKVLPGLCSFKALQKDLFSYLLHLLEAAWIPERAAASHLQSQQWPLSLLMMRLRHDLSSLTYKDHVVIWGPPG